MNANAPAVAGSIEPTPQQQRGMNRAILTQVVGSLLITAPQNGLLLIYFTHLELDSALIFTALAIPPLMIGVGSIPFAYVGDGTGFKKVGMPGAILMAAGFGVLGAAGLVPEGLCLLLVLLGLALYGFGYAMFSSVWFALLSPLVPEGMRGAFFGRLRVSWQLAAFLFGIACTLFLTAESPRAVFVAIMFTIAGLGLVRCGVYARVPQIDTPTPKREGLVPSLLLVARSGGYASFCCYVFLLMLFIGNVLNLFGLVEKKALGFGDDDIVWLGNFWMGGAISGFFLGGRMVDRWGTKPVFLVCHFAFAAVLVLFLMRDLATATGLSMFVYLAVLHAVYGLVVSASSIAISTETLALMAPGHKGLASALCQTLLYAGKAAGGFLGAGALNIGLLNDQWTLFGQERTVYDALLVIHAVMVVALVVALGLVPSVLHKAEWMARSD